MTNNLPPIPEDVLAAFDTLPEETLSQIEIQMVKFAGLEIISNPEAMASEKGLKRSMERYAREQCRLIRKAVRELKRG
jgi:hypothetical protein